MLRKKEGLFVIDKNDQRNTGKQVKYELVLNSNGELCYRVVENGIPRIRLLPSLYDEKKFELDEENLEKLDGF